MNQFHPVYVPIGVPTFHLESAEKLFQESVSLLQRLSADTKVPEKMLLSIDDLSAYLDGCSPDLIVLQNLTFANAAYASEVLHRFSCPIVLWTLREPVIDGGRLRLNSLTGAYSAANAMMNFGRGFEYIFGSPSEEPVQKQLAAAYAASALKKQLSTVRLAQIGHTPDGFGFGRALDLEMLKTFGVTVITAEARELMEKAKSYDAEDCSDYQKEAEEKTKGLDKLPAKNQADFIKLYRAYQEYVDQNHVSILATRCWPDFFVSYGTPVCSVLAMLNDHGTAAGCEGDAYGALSMYIGMQLSGGPVFFGDPVSMDETENTVTFWHCGTAACSLARKDTGAEIGVHCNRKIGPTMEFGCRPEKNVTLFRIGRKPDGSFRAFLSTGEALDKPKQFNGTSAVVKIDGNASSLVHESVQDGWEPHFVVIYADVKEELTMLAHMLNLEICVYGN